MRNLAETTIEEECDGQDFNKFFDEPIKVKLVKTPEIPPKKRNSYCASWVNDQSFEVNRADEPNRSINSGFECSPLSETVNCHEDQAKKSRNDRKTEKNVKFSKNSQNPFKNPTKRSQIVEEPLKKREKRTKPSPATKPTVSLIKNVNFFESIALATEEIRKPGPSKWRVIQGIHVQMDTDSSQNTEGSPVKSSPYNEFMALFRENVKIGDGINFEHTYPFDWDHFSRNGMQYVIFTKVCQSHPLGYFVEMRKEDTVCEECGGSDLSLTIRLTIPLSLSEIPVPSNQNLGIHVAFVAQKLTNSELGNVDFSKETAERMYDLYRKMMRFGTPSDEYRQWFQRCRQFVKTALFSKRLRLFHGRVIRRKFEEIDRFTKRRCFIFADVFEFE